MNVIVEPVPMTLKAAHVIEPEHVTDEVETLPKVLAPVKYGMLPITACDEVPRPLKPRVLPPVRDIGKFTESGAW